MNEFETKLEALKRLNIPYPFSMVLECYKGKCFYIHIKGKEISFSVRVYDIEEYINFNELDRLKNLLRMDDVEEFIQESFLENYSLILEDIISMLEEKKKRFEEEVLMIPKVKKVLNKAKKLHDKESR